MNPQGRKQNLRAAQPGNRNAEKTGVHSPRRRSEEARKIKRTLSRDPKRFLDQDLLDIFADLRAYAHLLARDIAERGVSDRHGKQRRSAGTYVRTLAMCMDLHHRIEASLAANALGNNEAEPWSEDEMVGLLRSIAHDGRNTASGRVAAIRFLKELMPALELSRDFAFYMELEKLPDEELQREIDMLRAAISVKEPPTVPAREMISIMAAQDYITEGELLTLRENLARELAPKAS